MSSRKGTGNCILCYSILFLVMNFLGEIRLSKIGGPGELSIKLCAQAAISDFFYTYTSPEKN